MFSGNSHSEEQTNPDRLTASIFAGPELRRVEVAGGQGVSGKRWPFRPDMSDQQVNKHRGGAQ